MMRTSGSGKPTSTGSPQTPQPTTLPDATVLDVQAAAAATGAPTEVVVEVLRSRLDLGVIGVSHALGINGTDYIRAGHRRPPALVAAADQLWAAVEPGAVPLPDIEPTEVRRWETAALCRGKDPHLWFCDEQANDDQIEAVGICVACPVIGHCALASLSEPHGLWAGMTERNRHRLRRFIRLGVVPETPVDIAPLAIDIAASSLAARIASRPATLTDDGRLFDVPESPEVTEHRRRTRRPTEASNRPQPVPLFA